jgi:hypothetical protein
VQYVVRFHIPLVMDGVPLNLVLGQQVPEAAVLGSSPGEHGEKPALALMDMGHVLRGGQFTVRYIEEVPTPGQATKQVPGGAMGLVVRHVAAGDLEIQRNRPIPGHREDVEQLLEVGPMVLIIAPRDRHSRLLASLFFLGGIRISAMEGDRGGVVVQLVQVDLELLDHMGRKRQDHRGDVASEQPIETTPDAVVVEG